MIFWHLVFGITGLIVAITYYSRLKQYKENSKCYYEVVDWDLFATSGTKKIYDHPKKKVIGNVIGWFITFLTIFGVIYLVTSSIFTSDAITKTTYEYKYNIYALEDNVTSTFVIRRHYQTDSQSGIRFYHIYKTSDGGKKIGWINQDSGTIYDNLNTNEQPYIEVYKSINDYESLPLWKKLFSLRGMVESEVVKEYKIYVPENTIREDYNIDLQ